MKPRRVMRAVILLGIVAGVAFSRGDQQTAQTQPPRRDPAAWGSTHVGQPIPEYVTGDECLFCHRNDIGPSWARDPHAQTIRRREDAPELAALMKSQPALAARADEIEFFLGGRKHLRFLKSIGYGRLALLNVRADMAGSSQARAWHGTDQLTWDEEKFSARCAGCHTTAVDSKTRTYSAFSLDCYTCHGVVDLKHSTNPSLVLLSRTRRREALVITSICASCHIRIGTSRSSGLPYPNTFVPGDNLFKDFAVDFARADDATLNPGDRHVLRNIRDVVLSGIETPTCLSCHDVHANSSHKHRRLPRRSICTECHNAEGPLTEVKKFTVHSALCEY